MNSGNPLDLIAATSCGIGTIACVFLLSFSSPKNSVWMDLPSYVRWGLIGLASTLAIRSVNFLSLYHGDLHALGHANLEAVAAGFMLSYVLVAMTYVAFRHAYPGGFWERMRSIFTTARQEPSEAGRVLESVVTVGAAVQLAKQDGNTVVMPGAHDWVQDKGEGLAETVDGSVH